MSTNNKETVPTQGRLVDLTELLQEVAHGLDEVEEGRLMSVAELRARYSSERLKSRGQAPFDEAK